MIMIMLTKGTDKKSQRSECREECHLIGGGLQDVYHFGQNRADGCDAHRLLETKLTLIQLNFFQLAHYFLANITYAM